MMTTLRENHLARRTPTRVLPATQLAPFRLAFGSCYAYSPKGATVVSEQSRLLCARVKQGNLSWLACYAARVRELMLAGDALSGFMDRGSVLIPIPKSVAAVRGNYWTARRLATALVSAGVAGSVWTGLSRASTVERSCAAWMWQRPTVQDHYQSFEVQQPVPEHDRIVLVDDVITKGRTLVAAAMRLREAFPRSDVRAFALVRTMGFVRDVERLVSPCVGEIRWDGKDAHRDP